MDLLEKVKKNLVLQHNEDDELLQSYINAAIDYATSYQKLSANFYVENQINPTTEQAIVMLSSFFYESRDGSTAGFFADSVSASQQVWNVVNTLLRLDRNWSV